MRSAAFALRDHACILNASAPVSIVDMFAMGGDRGMLIALIWVLSVRSASVGDRVDLSRTERTLSDIDCLVNYLTNLVP